MKSKEDLKLRFNAAHAELAALVGKGKRDLAMATRIIELMVEGKPAAKRLPQRLRHLLFGPEGFFLKQSDLARMLGHLNPDAYKNRNYTEVLIHSVLAGTRRPTQALMDEFFSCVRVPAHKAEEYEARKAEIREVAARMELLLFKSPFGEHVAQLDHISSAALTHAKLHRRALIKAATQG